MTDLSVATINLDNLGEWSHATRFERLTEAVNTALKRPMIIALQEVGVFAEKENVNLDAPLPATIDKTLLDYLNEDQPREAQYHYAEIAPKPFTTGGERNHHIRSAFLYRAPITLTDLRTLGEDSPFFTGNTLEGKEALSPSRRPLHGIFDLNGTPLHLINCHLKSMNAPTNDRKKIARRQRNAQAEQIRHEIQIYKEEPLMILGDFNDLPQSKTIEILRDHQSLASIWNDTPKPCYTYRYKNKPIVLDYILYNHHLTLIEVSAPPLNTPHLSPTRFSDHDPVVATFKL